MRRFLEPLWLEWHAAWGPPWPSHPSQWTCVRSSEILRAALCARQLDAVRQSGAALHGASGFHHDGQWQSHAWVTCGGFIIDITADQFGEAPVLARPATDPRYRAGADPADELRLTPASSAGVDAALRRYLSRG